VARILIQISNCKGNKKARDYLLGYRRSLKFEGKTRQFTGVEGLERKTTDSKDPMWQVIEKPVG